MSHYSTVGEKKTQSNSIYIKKNYEKTGFFKYDFKFFFKENVGK